MQTVAIGVIVQNADFSHSQNHLSFGMPTVGFDNTSCSFEDVSLGRNNNGKESFESMIQKASFEKKAQDEKRISDPEPDHSNENRAENTEKEERLSESPIEKRETVAVKDTQVAEEPKKIDLKSTKKNAASKSNASERKVNFENPQESKNAGKNERFFSEHSEVTHSLSETKRLSDASKVKNDFDKGELDAEHEFSKTTAVSDDEYALIAAENAPNFASMVSENAPHTDEQFADSDFLLSTDDFSVDTMGEIREDATIKTRFYMDSDKKILVSDFRTENSTEKTAETNAKSDSLRFGDVVVTDENTAQITVDLNAAELTNSNVLSTNNQTASANGSNFQAMLTNQIQQNASEFVRAGNIVLRDNDNGQIRLVLHPENLGNVKIDLHIEDKNITGRILVASSQAYNAFKDSADSLRNAFISSGFESASFDLNYSGQSGQGAEQNNSGQHQGNNAQYAISRTYGEYASSAGFDDFVDSGDFEKISSKNAVNIVA